MLVRTPWLREGRDLPMSHTADPGQASDSTLELLPHLGMFPVSLPPSPNLLLHPDSFPGTKKDVGGVGF